jgi:hypothetical protein
MIVDRICTRLNDEDIFSINWFLDNTCDFSIYGMIQEEIILKRKVRTYLRSGRVLILSKGFQVCQRLLLKELDFLFQITMQCLRISSSEILVSHIL